MVHEPGTPKYIDGEPPREEPPKSNWWPLFDILASCGSACATGCAVMIGISALLVTIVVRAWP